MRASFADVGLSPLVFVFKLTDLLRQSSDQFGIVGLTQALRFVIELSGQYSLAFQQRYIHALTHVGTRFGQQVKQTASALTFAHFNGKCIPSFGWLVMMPAHQQVGVKLVRGLDRD